MYGAAESRGVVAWRGALCLGLAVLYLTAAGCASPQEALRLQGETMGTSYHLVVYAGAGGLDAQALAALADDSLAEATRLFSTYEPDSVLSQFNASTRSGWFPVPQRLARVVALAQRLSKLSGGALDVTVGAWVDAWGFGRSEPAQLPPPAAVIESLRPAVGADTLEVRLDPPALRKQHAATRVDLSAIAKGEAVDELLRRIMAAGAEAALVEIGGEVRVQGAKPDGTPWRVAVESPSLAVDRVISLENAAVATSGDYRNYFSAGGQRYSHILDPHTGYPIRNHMAAATVVADSTAEADGLATALMVMGMEAGARLAESQELAVLLTQRNPNGFKEYASSRFRSEYNGAGAQSAAAAP